MRVGVVDIGTNSTRLLVAEVVDGRVTDVLARESIVTRLGQGVDATGALADEAMERVFSVLDRYKATIDDLGVEATFAALTSAVRDASNGAAFTETVRERYGLDAYTLPGDDEATLTFLGATSERDPDATDEAVVIDIGGGSTEFVTGRGPDVTFFTSLQMGVVRMGERHMHSDPPVADELGALRDDVAATIADGVPAEVLGRIGTAIGVGGTATWSASIVLAEEHGRPVGPEVIHGHVLDAATIDALLERLAGLTEAQRREVPGLDPDRAPTIVAGVAMLRECLRAFGLDRVEVSEHDILRGAALRRSAPA